MKNIKNIIATLVLVGGLGVSNSYAGLILSDFTGHIPQQCEQPTNNDSITGLILSDFGLILSDILGYETPNECTQGENNLTGTGLILSD